MAWVFGYLRASWTLRADLLSDFVCRLLRHMDQQGAQVVTPTLRPQDAAMALAPWITQDNFNAGYLVRSAAALPRQGDRQPWLHSQDYAADRISLPAADLDDGSLVYR